MVCGSCGTENPAGSKFCNRCAARLASPCPACGTPNVPGSLFCNECAAPLGAAPAPAAPGFASASVPVAERRLVSVLFADLVGFTPFAEERDSEDVRDTLTRYFDLASDVITRYGGTVEKFIGDAVMAVWGAPVAREDDAERAVRAGLELVDAVRSLGPSIQARAGVLTGEAAVTIGATNQGMIAGDLVNTAARLQGVAPAGAVLVGEATHRAASRAIVFEEAGEQALKGKQAPVAAWRALRVVAKRGGGNRTETLEAPFVGRDDELRLLKDLFHATGRERRARLVSVVGPAGIGKSRLAWEFLKYVDGLVEDVWWHDGRSPAYGDGITFWALGEIVRVRCGLIETDDERTTRAKVAETVATHVPDVEERRWIEPSLLALLGFEAGVGSEQLFGAWRTFFERLADSAPVVLVFEDFHFADSGLLDFVDHLLEWSRNVPIYVVTLARPELIEKRETWGAGKRNFTSLYLEPLPEAAMRALLAGLVPGLPEAAVRSIVARADGVPLYAVETVRMLLAEGKLVVEGDGTYAPTGDLTTLAVPETLTALIASRLDGLDPAERTVVSDAAVLGQSFTLAGLSAVSGIAEAELEPRLRALARRELLVLEADPRSPERGQYAFVQALIREVAYRTLAKADRKARHLAAARYFEARGSDELAGALAGHYLAARDNATEGPERDALASQARLALRGAGERAAALGAHDGALAFFEQALTVATDRADRADLLERAGEEARAAARVGRAESLLRAAVALRRESGDRPATSRATAALGRALLDARRFDDALALLEPAAAEFADLFPDPADVFLEAQLARAYFLHEEPRRAIEAAERVLEAADHADLLEILADTLVTRGSALGSLGRLREGIGVIEIGEKISRARGDTDTLMRALNNRCAYLFDVEPSASTEVAREGLALARTVGDRGAILLFLNHQGWAAVLSGDPDGALAAWESSLAEDPEAADRMWPLEGIIWVRAMRGGDVSEPLREHEGLAAQLTDSRMRAGPLDLSAFRAFSAGRLAESQQAWRAAAAMDAETAPLAFAQAARAALWDGDAPAAAIDLAAIEATGQHAPIIDLRRQVIRAGLAALDGRPADALAIYRECLRAWRDLGLAWDEALCGIDVATLLDPAEPEVRAAAERAREILVRLEARPFIERLDATMTRGSATRSVARSPSGDRVAT